MGAEVSDHNERSELYRIGERFLANIRKYMEAKNAQRVAEKTARDAKAIADREKRILMGAMGEHPVALCGNVMIQIVKDADSPAGVTLSDGTRIPLSDIQAIVVNGVRIPGTMVEKLSSGRTGPTTLQCSEI